MEYRNEKGNCDFISQVRHFFVQFWVSSSQFCLFFLQFWEKVGIARYNSELQDINFLKLTFFLAVPRLYFLILHLRHNSDFFSPNSVYMSNLTFVAEFCLNITILTYLSEFCLHFTNLTFSLNSVYMLQFFNNVSYKLTVSISQFFVFTLQFCIYFLKFWDYILQFYLFSQNCKKNCQHCEIKHCNYLFCM